MPPSYTTGKTNASSFVKQRTVGGRCPLLAEIFDQIDPYLQQGDFQSISKIVERVFLTRLVSHVKQSPNYNPFQSAYRRGHSFYGC